MRIWIVLIGVYRMQHDRQIFIESSFSRVIDLLGDDVQKSNKFLDIATLPITEVMSMECDQSDEQRPARHPGIFGAPG